MNICVCGLGKLGSPIAAAFAASSVPTVGLDLDLVKVTQLSKFVAPVVEPQLAEYLQLQVVRENLRATTDVRMAVAASDACLFVTPTPSLRDGSFDHTPLLTAMTSVARECSRTHRRRFLFIVNSTVCPGFMAGACTTMLARQLGDLGFMLAYKPEFIALGTVIQDLHYPDMLLIGADDQEAAIKTEQLYREMVFTPLPNKPMAKHMSLVEAELAKISLNCAVTMKISFANQIGLVAQRMGANPFKVLDAVGEDGRIGHGYLKPGLPFGGPCFPRDNRMFQFIAAQVGERAPMAEATDVMNRRVLRSVIETLPAEGDIGILGLSYKPGTATTEEAPGYWWKQVLMSRGRRVKAHDVQASHQYSIADVLRCPIVIVATAWPEYRSLVVSAKTLLIDPMGVIEKRSGACQTPPCQIGPSQDRTSQALPCREGYSATQSLSQGAA